MIERHLYGIKVIRVGTSTLLSSDQRSQCCKIKILYALWFLFFLFGAAYSLTVNADMDLTEEAKNDEKFLREHKCFPEHFRLAQYLNDGQFWRVVKYSDTLERIGYRDRYVLIYKAHALYKLGRYQEAILGFEQSMRSEYICHLTAFRGRFMHPEKIADAITLFNVSEIYHALSEDSLEQQYFQEAMDLFRHSLIEQENVPAERVDGMVSRILATSSLNVHRDIE